MHSSSQTVFGLAVFLLDIIIGCVTIYLTFKLNVKY